MTEVTPYKSSESKKKQVINMFNNIAKNYDCLNSSLSIGMDKIWRKRAIKEIQNIPKKILDVATGTADFAISGAKYTNAKIIGIDISEGMLEIAKKKIKKRKLENRIQLQLADSEKIPFQDNSFDAITVGFGVRNFENIEKGLKEIYRVLKSKGTLVILEPSIPKKSPFRQVYKLYFNHLLPKIGKFISQDKEAYSYLPESVAAFPSNKRFINKLNKIGFKESRCIPLSLGIVSLFIAIK